MELLAHAASPLASLGVQSSTAILQACHPSVIDFLTEYGIAAWPVGHADAHRFWAVYTSDQDCINGGLPENLYIQVSDDGVTWEVSPFGLALNGSETQKRLTSFGLCNISYVGQEQRTVADPGIIYDEWNDQILIFSIAEEKPSPSSGDITVKLKRQTLSNTGVVGTLQDTNIGPTWNYDAPLLSPAVVYATQNHLHLWGVCDDRWFDGVQTIYHAESTDNGLTWTTPAACGPNTNTFWPGHFPWHLDAKLRPGGGGTVDLLIMSEPADGNYGQLASLLPMQTTHAAPTTISAPLATDTILDKRPAEATEWDKSLYRSAFVPRWENYELTFDVWYDGVTVVGTYDRVGFTSGGLGIFSGPTVYNNRPAGSYAPGTTITLSIPAGSTADTVEYGWGATPPVSPSVYSAPVTIQESTLWWRGVDGTTPGDWQSAAYLVQAEVFAPASGFEFITETGSTVATGSALIQAAGIELAIELGQATVITAAQAAALGLEIAVELGEASVSAESGILPGWYVRGDNGKLYGLRDSQGRIHALQQ
jgi:hypothetical protein